MCLSISVSRKLSNWERLKSADLDMAGNASGVPLAIQHNATSAIAAIDRISCQLSRSQFADQVARLTPTPRARFRKVRDDFARFLSTTFIAVPTCVATLK